MSEALQRLIDKNEIHETLLRYARGADRHDKELVRSAYFEDATDEHGNFTATRDSFVEQWYQRNLNAPMVSHVLGNCFIEFASDTLAVVETYYIATAELDPNAEGPRKMLGAMDNGQSVCIDVFGRYVDRFEKRKGEWRIARRRVVFDSSEIRPVARTTTNGIQGRRDSQDAIYLARAEAGLK